MQHLRATCKQPRSATCALTRARVQMCATATEAPPHHVNEHAVVSTSYQHSLLKSKADYERMYQESISDPAGFWATIASGYHWEQRASPGTGPVNPRGL